MVANMVFRVSSALGCFYFSPRLPGWDHEKSELEPELKLTLHLLLVGFHQGLHFTRKSNGRTRQDQPFPQPRRHCSMIHGYLDGA